MVAISARGSFASTTYLVGDPQKRDKVVTASHPEAFGQDEQPGEWRNLADPGAIEQVDYTLGAVDTEQLQTRLLRHLIEARIVSTVKAAELLPGTDAR